MRWSGKARLMETLEQLRKQAEPHLEVLRRDLLALGVEGAQQFLRENLEIGLTVARAGRQRRQTVAQYPPDQQPWALYAAAAWTAKAVVLLEQLEILQLEPRFPAKFAGEATLTLVGRYENEDELWVWPFEGFSPWDYLEE